MALDAKVTLTHPIQIDQTAGSSSGRAILINSGSPDGNTDPYNSAAKGSVFIRTDATDDYPSLYVKIDADGADDDWVPVIVEKSEMDHTLEGHLTMDADKRTYYRDTDISVYSSAACKLSIVAPSGVDVDKLTVGTGTYVSGLIAGSATLAFGAIAASAASTACLAITGLTQGHYIFLAPSGMAGSLVLTGWGCSPGGGVLKVDVANLAVETTAACDIVFGYLALAACGA